MTSCRRSDAAVPGRRGGASRLPLLLAALLALLAVAGRASSQTRASESLPGGSAPGAGAMLEPGAAAPGFVVKDTAGETFDFEAEKAKSPHLLVFFSVFCDPCRRTLAVLQRLHEKYAGAGWRMAGIALDGEPLKAAVDGFARQEGYGFRVLIDELDARDMFKAADPFGVSEMPAVFVIEKGGRVLFSRKGAVLEGELEKAMHPVPKK